MTETIVIYKSKHGHTKKYAEYIAEKLGADLIRSNELSGRDLSLYKTVVFGGPIYAGMINGIKDYQRIFDKYPSLKKVLFMVGMTDVNDLNYWNDTVTNNFRNDKILNTTKFFHLSGGLDVSSLGFLSRKIISSIIKKAESKENKTENDINMIKIYKGEKVQDNALADIVVDYVKSL